jgi:hypothetical protein
MTVIRIGSRLREFLYGTEPDEVENPELFELVEYLQGFPTYPTGIELPEKFWSDVWYYADLLGSSDPDVCDLRSVNAALNDLTDAGFDYRRNGS